jgi:hypothetical protein
VFQTHLWPSLCFFLGPCFWSTNSNTTNTTFP